MHVAHRARLLKELAENSLSLRTPAANLRGVSQHPGFVGVEAAGEHADASSMTVLRSR